MINFSTSFFAAISLSLIMLVSCGRKDSSDTLLAEVENERLYLSEILIPENLSPEDSVSFLKNMVQSWIVEQLMYLDASSKLSEQEMQKIEKRMEHARKLMVISALEENLVSDSIKITVSAEEIQKYYRENPDEFQLKENIVKVMYLKLKKAETDVAKFRSLLKSDNTSGKAELAAMAREKALNYFLEDNVWLYFNDILKEIPIKAENQADFLKSNTFYEVSNDSVIYLVRFNGYMLSESSAPLILVRDRIESVLIARKKNMLLNDYRNKMYENALKEKKVTLHID
ncbi:MAG: hypothetical protein A2W93_05915 [Bacteroidetes bacterium GWF2_43_63]|nr:MAG: hypothetical protein A2W94_04410 [Bacteroidetes bacterium GWE2_42_42]OFY55954.1 MAG: hypothetical protein A2W93_05915 [Bacteroidetes bacterium GWF2_43_63]HBG71523.1 hypothetical protein [Bacteroidales bacterium]HCB62995.1 hypothetical protein [Bacteroidales bacterium]HCY22284.1 hypothetical protein [Bacteroidales bacterium]